MSISASMSGNVIEMAFAGQFGTKQAVEAVKQAVRQSDAPKPVLLLADMSKSAELKTEKDLVLIAQEIGSMGPAEVVKVAVLVAQPVRYGIARQFGAYLEAHGIACQPFYERSEALEWLHKKYPVL